MRNRRLIKHIAVFVLVNMLVQIFFPATAWALTGGPSQPEVQSFEPATTNQMVDPFTGDFVYNIPLLDVGGYPINISYHSGINMDQEASWAGLGWNINPGVINRNVRGLPDDFDGDSITKESHIKPNQTGGVNLGVGLEIIGLPQGGSGFGLDLSIGLGIFYNNYKGWGYDFSIDPSISAGNTSKWNLNAGLGLDLNSQEGIGINPSLSYSIIQSNADKGSKSTEGVTIGAPYNSRSGMKSLTFGTNFSTESEVTRTVTADDGSTTTEDLGSSKLSGSNGGSIISFGTKTYTPEITMPMENYNYSFRFTLGSEVLGFNGHAYINGYGSGQQLVEPEQNVPAYGYLNLQDAKGHGKYLLDFNREKDGPYTDDMPNLPLANLTYDIYSVEANGLGGCYRPYRSDIGYVADEYVSNSSSSGSVGIELGGTDLLKLGINVGINNTQGYSSGWTSTNSMSSNLQFRGQGDYPDTSMYEPFYFKNAGEKEAIDEAFYGSVNGDDVIAPHLADIDNIDAYMDGDQQGNTFTIPTQNARTQRDKRNQPMTFLDAEDAANFGLDKNIVSYKPNTFYSNGNISDSLINRVSAYARKHHISEVTILKPDGTRYIFGTPAYNRYQREATFAVTTNAPQTCLANGLVPMNYVSDSKYNISGSDNYYNATETPPFAYSYLLTAILSPDYVDVTGDGITDDDYGTATKFNYTLAVPKYIWRVPYEQNEANYSEGFKTDPTDDKGSYLYGQKDIWYLNSIVSKHYIAEFKTSSRYDGFPAYNQYGGLNPADSLKTMKKLDRIELYSKQDREINGIRAQPIKVVHFEYDYSLCKGISNNVNAPRLGYPHPADSIDVGKLTLKKIYFTYENSQEGELNPYQFTYSSYNPNYNLKGYDRWGNFKPNATAGACDSLSYSNKRLCNADYPYVDQDSANTNLYASAWSLSKIDLPSGGTIRVNYESDDYAYVQNQRAMQMCQVAYASNSPTGGSNQLYSGNNENVYLFFNLQGISTTDTSAARKYVYNEYLDRGNVKQVYFKFLCDLMGNNNLEFVPGYANIDYSSYGVVAPISGPVTTGFIKIATVPLKNDKKQTIGYVNPIAMAAWQFLRLNVPKLLYSEVPGTGASNDGVFIKSMVNFAMDVKSIFGGYNKACRSKLYAQNFISNKSFIRLCSPTKHKLGGGARVKQISISDNWNNMVSGADSAAYGQVYDYTTQEMESDGSIQTISSGVASYEPSIGGDENPWHTPVTYNVDNLLAPDDNHYQETPFGESFFPSPTVGYSQVKVSNLPHPGVKRTATGYTIQKFYTTKDFPTITKQTGINPVKVSQNNMLNWIFRIGITDYTTVSQGYCIELNDMNGKPKAQWVYAENKKDPISGVEYYYRTNKQNPNMLDNNVTVIYKDGTVTNTEIGIDFDVTNDMREQATETDGTNLGFNLDLSNAGFIPLPLITFWPSYSNEDTRFRSAVTTKVVQRYGLLDSVVAYDNTSRITTENVAYDGETGEVLLTRTQNEWEDPVYTFNYPAHWGYTGMSGAYQNIGAQFWNLNIINGIAKGIQHPELYFMPGDEIMITKYVSGKYSSTHFVISEVNPGILVDKIWASEIDGKLVFIDRWGNRVNMITNHDPASGNDDYEFKIIRSGYRNQQSTSIGSVTTLYNPLKNPTHLQLDSQVLSTTATEFSEDWQTYCSKLPYIQCDPINQKAKDFLKILSALARTTDLGDYDTASNSSGAFTVKIYDTLSGRVKSNYVFYGSTTLKAYLDSEVSAKLGSYCGSLGSDQYYGRLPYHDSAGNTVSGVLHGYFMVTDCGVPIEASGCDFYLTSKDTGFDFTDIDSFSNLTPAGYAAGPDYYFYITAYRSELPPVVLTGVSCFKVSDCYNACTAFNAGQIVNPYLYGLRGSWRPKRSHLYLQKRAADTSSHATNIRKNGPILSYHHFWNNPGDGTDWQPNTGTKQWVWNSEVTKYSPYGTEIEDKDPLGRYSSAIFDFQQSVPAAVANNAKYEQIASDGFEDYESYFFSPLQGCQPETHWKFDNAVADTLIDTTISHTGKRSIRVKANRYAEVYRSIDTISGATPADTLNYKIRKCDCLPQFAPDTAEKYVFSGWVKQSMSGPAFSYTQPYVQVEIYRTHHTPIIDTLRASGAVIEGWQRIYGTFTIPDSATGIDVFLKAGTTQTNFDDLRMLPFNANIKTYVYDPISLRLMAEIDENNYATLYEYDQEGALIRVKKETVKGIMTIKESRNSKTKAKL